MQLVLLVFLFSAAFSKILWHVWHKSSIGYKHVSVVHSWLKVCSVTFPVAWQRKMPINDDVNFWSSRGNCKFYFLQSCSQWRLSSRKTGRNYSSAITKLSSAMTTDSVWQSQYSIKQHICIISVQLWLTNKIHTLTRCNCRY